MLTIPQYVAEFERREHNRVLKRVGSDLRLTTTNQEAMELRKVDFVEVLGEDAMAEIAQRVRGTVRKQQPAPTPAPAPAPEPLVKHARGCPQRSLAQTVSTTWYKHTQEDMPWRDACIIAGTLPWGEVKGASLTDEGVEQTLAEELDEVLARYPGVLDLDDGQDED